MLGKIPQKEYREYLEKIKNNSDNPFENMQYNNLSKEGWETIRVKMAYNHEIPSKNISNEQNFRKI